MTLDNSYICLKGLRFHAFHGVMEQEAAVGNEYVVDLRMECDLGKAMKSDNVEHTLNYATAYDIVREEMMKPSRLIENVAYRIAKRLGKAFPEIISIEIRVTKTNPPMGADCDGAMVELHFSY
ncbi:MAG: dihydroneopterin aldolase [Prevotella sp.]|nr:dihydroneopterin aldolase [Prevotella sp.]